MYMYNCIFMITDGIALKVKETVAVVVIGRKPDFRLSVALYMTYDTAKQSAMACCVLYTCYMF